MKKFLALSAAALLCGAMSLSAKTADELRIYINPGHGSWGPNDRPCDVIKNVDGQPVLVQPNTSGQFGTVEEPYSHEPDTTAFYESNTNLQKGLELLRQLQALGLTFDPTKNQENDNPARVGAALDLTQNIVMSHVKCGPFPMLSYASSSGKYQGDESYNRNLTEVAKEVETNNFDMFISIHSNAATEGTTTNYPLFLYRGPDDVANVEVESDAALVNTSKAMAAACWPHWIANGMNVWTSYKTSTNIRGDWDFYSSHSTSSATGAAGYLGVLKHHVPGFLVEGYFHTYQPARHRAMNWDADHMEGYAYAMGVADYFGLTKPATGNIFGQVRDKFEKFSHDKYKPNITSADAYLPLCGATVTLKQGDNVVDTYTTDQWYNGVYVFKNVAPGDYTIEVAHPDYRALTEPVAVTVKAAATAQPDAIYMINNEYQEPDVTYYDYVDPLEGNEAIGAAGEYVFAEPTKADTEALNGLNIRRSILRDGKQYILAFDADNAATIVVRDAAAQTVLATLSTEGTSGNIRGIADIALTADGYLIAMNAQTGLAFGGANMIEFYRWDKDDNGLPTGSPVSMGSNNHAGNWTAAEFGKTMVYEGTLADGTLYFANKSTANNNTRIEINAFVDGQFASAYHNNFNSMTGIATGVTDAALGDYQYCLSPLHENALIFTCENALPFEVLINKASAGIPTLVAQVPEGVMTDNGFRASVFKMAGAVFMAVPQADGVELYNITDGLDKIKRVTTNSFLAEEPEEEVALKRAWAEVGAGVPSANGECVVKTNNAGEFSSYHVDLYLTRANGEVVRFTTEGQDQPVNRANFAYDLAQTEENGNYTVTFKSTGAAPAGRVILTNIADAEDTLTFDLGEVRYGDNEYTIAASDIDGTKDYNWAVEVIDNGIAESAKFFNQNAPFPNVSARGGVVMITDPEQPSFGKIAMSVGYARGIYLFEPDNTLLGVYHTNASTMASSNGSSLMRGGQRADKAIFIDWSDGGAGYWEFDPMNPETPLRNILAGTADSDGCFKLDGTPIGGGATSIEFVGKGEDELCYVWCEDYPAGNGNNFIRYSSAGKDIIDMAPDQVWNGSNGFRNLHSLYANTNVEINAIPQGLVINQNRGVGSNSAGCPSIEIYKYDGTRLFNSGAEDYQWISTSGGCAVTADGKLMAAPSWGKGIDIFRLDWAEDGNSVDVVHLYNINAPSSGTSAEYTQMIFDPAGNLYAFDRAKGLQMFSIKNSDPRATTPAPKALVISGSESGVENVTIESNDTNAPVEYFTLQGIRVNHPVKGQVVIRRQGNNVSKIVVK